ARAAVQDDTREMDDLLAYWLGPATADGSIPRDRAALWFGGAAATDRDVRTRFGDALPRACRGGGAPRRGRARGGPWPVAQRFFPPPPFEHAEAGSAQDESVRRFTGLVEEAPPVVRAAFEEFLRYAVDHRDCIARFGRFPQRNATLGRTSTPEERAFLDKLPAYPRPSPPWSVL